MERVPIEDCFPELTPVGWGVRVGDVTWTCLGQGYWLDDMTAEQRHERIEAMLKVVKGGTIINLGAFMLGPRSLFSSANLGNKIVFPSENRALDETLLGKDVSDALREKDASGGTFTVLRIEPLDPKYDEMMKAKHWSTKKPEGEDV